MRVTQFIAESTRIFGMDYLFKIFDNQILENKKVNNLHWGGMYLIIVFAIIPILLIGLIIIILLFLMDSIELLFTKIIYRNKITIEFKNSIIGDEILKTIINEFHYKINYKLKLNQSNIILYFLKELDLSFFIIKYSEKVVFVKNKD